MRDFWFFLMIAFIIWFSFQIGVSVGFSEAFDIIEELKND